MPPRAGGPCPRPEGCGGGEGAALGPAAPPVSLRPRASPGSISERPGREVGREPARRGGRGGQGPPVGSGRGVGAGGVASGCGGEGGGRRLCARPASAAALPEEDRRPSARRSARLGESGPAARPEPPAGDVPAVALLSAAPRAARSRRRALSPLLNPALCYDCGVILTVAVCGRVRVAVAGSAPV